MSRMGCQDEPFPKHSWTKSSISTNMLEAYCGCAWGAGGGSARGAAGSGGICDGVTHGARGGAACRARGEGH